MAELPVSATAAEHVKLTQTEPRPTKTSFTNRCFQKHLGLSSIRTRNTNFFSNFISAKTEIPALQQVAFLMDKLELLYLLHSRCSHQCQRTLNWMPAVWMIPKMSVLFYPERYTCIAILLILVQNVGFAQKGEVPVTGSIQTDKNVKSELTAFDYSFPALGTTVQLTVYTNSQEIAESAFGEAEQLTGELAGILSDYDPDSETRRLSDRSALQPVQVSDVLWQVLKAADHWNQRSDGAFDCSLGALTSAWRKHRRANRIPSPELIRSAKRDTGWQQIELNHHHHTVVMKSPRVRLDFGAIGKGFIVDRIFQLFQKQGLKSCLINISGNMRLGDAPPGREHWKIAISPIEPHGQPIRCIGLFDKAIATSGDLWQYSWVDNQKLSHILDPATGYGVPGPLAVTVICPNAIDADALATIGCVQPWTKFSELIESVPGAMALRASTTSDSLRIQETDNFPTSLSLSDE